jgi:hypothetical protein
MKFDISIDDIDSAYQEIAAPSATEPVREQVSAEPSLGSFDNLSLDAIDSAYQALTAPPVEEPAPAPAPVLDPTAERNALAKETLADLDDDDLNNELIAQVAKGEDPVKVIDPQKEWRDAQERGRIREQEVAAMMERQPGWRKWLAKTAPAADKALDWMNPLSGGPVVELGRQTIGKLIPGYSKYSFAVEQAASRMAEAVDEALDMNDDKLPPPVRLKALPKEQWEAAGEKGIVEAMKRLDVPALLPFSPAEMADSGLLLASVNRMKANDYSDKKHGAAWKEYDQRIVEDFLLKTEENQKRGTVRSAVVEGMSILPGFMAEFMLTGGIASIGKATIRKTAEELLKKHGKSKLMKMAIKGGTRVAGGMTSATIRTPAMAPRIGAGTFANQLPKEMSLTPEGKLLVKESGDSPFTAFMRATGDTWVEMFSETAGEDLARIPGVKKFANLLRGALKSTFLKSVPGATIEGWRKMGALSSKTGYSNLIAEMGEERLGGVLRAVMNIDDFGAKDPESVFSRLVAAIPGGKDLLVEGLILTLPMGGQALVAGLADRKKQPEEGGTVKVTPKPDDPTITAVPWQQTADEALGPIPEAEGERQAWTDAARQYKAEVESAIEAGEPVPDNVVASLEKLNIPAPTVPATQAVAETVIAIEDAVAEGKPEAVAEIVAEQVKAGTMSQESAAQVVAGVESGELSSQMSPEEFEEVVAKVATPPPTPAPGVNPYLTMPIDTVRKHADMGVDKAKAALKERDGKAPAVVPAVIETDQKRESKESKFDKKMEQWAKRLRDESMGQSVLDTMEERNESPLEIMQEFYGTVYDTLPDHVRAKFDRYIDALGYPDKGTLTHKERGLNGDYGTDADKLQGTERGHVALARVAVEMYRNERKGIVAELEPIKPPAAQTAEPKAKIPVPAPTEPIPSPVTTREGKPEGNMVGPGDVLTTATGRQTTAVPAFSKIESDRKAQNAERKINRWLVENAIAEATARGDEFNLGSFQRMMPGKLSRADVDVLNMYLFDNELAGKTSPQTAALPGPATQAAENVEPAPAPAEVTPASAEGPGAFTALTPHKNIRVSGRWRVVDSSELVTSDKPGYPQEYQPRNRATSASVEQIEKIAANVQPELLGESSTTDTGAPMIDSNGNVISGNGRVMAIRRSADGGKNKAYNDFVISRAFLLGIADQAAGKANPVLVREITDTGNTSLAEIAELSNRPQVLSRSQSEQAEADAKSIISANIMPLFQPNEDGDVLTAANRDFNKAFVNATGDASLMQSDGTFSPVLEQRVRYAMLAAIFNNHPDARRLVARIIEKRTELGIKRQMDAVMAVGGRLSQLAEKLPDYNLRPFLAKALEDLIEYRGEKLSGRVKTLDAFLDQGTLFQDTARVAESTALLEEMDKAKSVAALVNYFNAYINAAEKKDTSTADMFVTQEESIASVLRRTSDAIAQQSANRDKATGDELPWGVDAAPVPKRDGNVPADAGSKNTGRTPQPRRKAAKSAASAVAPKAKPEVKAPTDNLSNADNARLKEIQARLRQKLMGQVNMGFDPEILTLSGEMAVLYAKGGTKTFAQFASRVKADMADAWDQMKVYLHSAWQAAGATNPSLDDVSRADAARAISTLDDASPPLGTNNEIRDLLMSDARMGVKAFRVKKMADAAGVTVKEMQEQIEAEVVRMADEIASSDDTSEAKFQQLLSLYNKQPVMSARTSTSIEDQAYSTPAPLAFLSGYMIDAPAAESVYEPTAGNGMMVIGVDKGKVTANELNQSRADNLRALGIPERNITTADATTHDPGGSFESMSMNPPFGSLDNTENIDGYAIKKLDHLIALRALRRLASNGRATIIVGTKRESGKIGRGADRTFLNYLYNKFNVVAHFEVDGDLYGKQGAKWPVRVIVLDGRRMDEPAVAEDLAPESVDRLSTWDYVYTRAREVRDEIDARRAGMGPGGQGLASVRAETGATPAGQSLPVPVDAGRPAVASGRRGGRGRRSSGGKTPLGQSSVRGSDDSAGSAPPLAGRNQNAAERSGGRGELPGGLAERGGRDIGESAQTGTTGRVESNGRESGPGAIPGKQGSLLGEQLNEGQHHYTPLSNSPPLGTQIPSNIASAVAESLATLRSRVGDVDQWLADQLGYADKESLFQAMAGEQVDGVALTIDQMMRGGAVVVGDETGIGKGRQAAAVIRWAKRNGYVPVFITKDPKLFTDLSRDVVDVGDSIRPFILADRGKGTIVDEDNNALFRPPTSNKRGQEMNRIVSDGMQSAGYDSIILTYSQLNTTNEQQRFLSSVADGNQVVVIMDESHDASGKDSMQGAFIRGGQIQRGKGADRKTITLPGLLNNKNVVGTMYLSATYAKRPENLPLYFKTLLGRAAKNPEELVNAMKRGGVALQQAIAEALAKVGQYIRRERDFKGVDFERKHVALDREQELTDTVDNVTVALREIRAFSDIVRDLVKSGKVTGKATSLTQTQSDVTPFASVAHNYVSQMLLALKVDSVIAEAVESFKRGEKPVIALMNTMESFLTDYAIKNKVGTGQLINLSFKDMLIDALDKTMRVTDKDAKGKSETTQLTPADFGLDREYDSIVKTIRGLQVDLPASPIDAIAKGLRNAGIRMGELTGRTSGINYEGEGHSSGIYERRTKADKNAVVNGFNNGDFDAMILNASGSTGLSIHASPAFRERPIKTRNMIIAQPHLDVTIVVQMMGRIRRTGMIPGGARYTLPVLPLEIERRPALVLERKLKSLNANTTAAADGAVRIEQVDFLNKYGDDVIARYLVEDEPDLQSEIGLYPEVAKTGEIKPDKDDYSVAFTGRMALMPNWRQKRAYEAITQAYIDHVEYLKATDQYDLEVKTYDDWDGTMVSDEVLIQGEDESSIFTASTRLQQWDIKDTRRVHTAADINAEFKQKSESAEKMQAGVLSFVEDIRNRYERKLSDIDGRIKKLESNPQTANDVAIKILLNNGVFLRNSLTRFNDVTVRMLRSIGYGAGQFVTIENKEEGDSSTGMIVDITYPKQSPGIIKSQPGSIILHVVTNRPGGRLRIPMSQLTSGRVQISKSYMSDEQVDVHRTGGRYIRHVIVGNPIRAIEAAGNRGRLVSFNDKEGKTISGLLMPMSWNPSQMKSDPRADLVNATAVASWLSEQRSGVTSGDIIIEPVSGYSRSLRITVPASKRTGGAVYLDREVRRITGDFDKRGNRMIAAVEAESVPKLVERLMKLTNQSFRPTNINREGAVDAVQKINAQSVKGGRRGVAMYGDTGIVDETQGGDYERGIAPSRNDLPAADYRSIRERRSNWVQNRTRWQRQLNRIVAGSSAQGNGRDVRLAGLRLARGFAETEEFARARIVTAAQGYTAIPVVGGDFEGGVVLEDSKIVLFKQDELFQYFAGHELAHILDFNGDADVQGLNDSVDTNSPAFAMTVDAWFGRRMEWYKEKYHDAALRNKVFAQEFVAAYLGGMDDLRPLMVIPNAETLRQRIKDRVLEGARRGGVAMYGDAGPTDGEILVDPNDLVFVEEWQNRKDSFDNLETKDFLPIVVRNYDGKMTIVDGHNRAQVAKERGDKLSAVVISQEEYDFAKENGYDEIEISWAALERNDEEGNNLSSAISNQFPGTRVAKEGAKLLEQWNELREQPGGTEDESKDMAGAGGIEQPEPSRGGENAQDGSIREGAVSSIGRDLAEWDSLRERSLTRWERQLDTIREEASGEGATTKDRQRLTKIKLSADFAESSEFRSAHEKNAELGWDTIPIEDVEWGGVTLPNQRIVLLGDSRSSGFTDYYDRHERFHILSRISDPAATTLSDAIDLDSATAIKWKKITGLRGTALQEELAAAIAGGMDEILPAVTSGIGSKVMAAREAVRVNTQETKTDVSDVARRDTAYLAAVERGDMAEAQRMVDEAAKKAIYEAVDNASDSEELGLRMDKPGIKHFRRSFNRPDGRKTTRLPGVSVLGIGYDNITEENVANVYDKIGVYRTNGNRVYLLAGDSPTDVNDQYANDPGERIFTTHRVLLSFSADPVTRDDAGNIIPLSKRFDDEQSDISFGDVTPYYPANFKQRPDLANPAKTKPVRDLVDKVDEGLNRQGIPTPQTFAQWNLRAGQLLANHRDQIREQLLAGQLPADDPAMVLATKRLIEEEGATALKSKDKGVLMAMARAIRNYRVTGTEIARAMCARRDSMMTPEERRRKAIEEAMIYPGDDIMNELDKAKNEAQRQKVVAKMWRTRQRMIEIIEAMGLDPFNIPEELWKDKYKVAELMRGLASSKATTSDKVYEYWINGILSAPTTHVANVIGNTANIGNEYLVQRVAEATLADVGRLFGAKNEQAPSLGEIKFMSRFALHGLAVGGRNMVEAFRTEQAQLDAGTKFEGPRAAIGGTGGRIVRIPGRFLIAADELAKGIVYNMELAAVAYRTAKARGMTGAALEAEANRMFNNPTAEQKEEAIEEAKRMTFQTELTGPVSTAVKHFRRIPGGRYIVPFVRTPTNILKTGIAKTPFGLIGMAYNWHAGAYEGNSRKLNHDIAEQMLAFAIQAGILAIVFNQDDDDPILTGSIPPGMKSAERAYRQQNIPPQSVKIAGKWYSFSRIEPYATSMTIMIDTAQAVKDAQDGNQAASAIGTLLSSAKSTIRDKTFLQGLGDIMSAIEEGDSWGSKTEQAMTRFLGSWTPNIVRSPIRAMDDVVRDAHKGVGGMGAQAEAFAKNTVYQAFPLAGVEWWAKQPARLDHWGREVKKGEAFNNQATDVLYRMIVPIRLQKATNSDTLDHMVFAWNQAQAKEGTPERQWWPSTPDRTMTVRGEKVKLNEEQFEKLLVTRAKMVKDMSFNREWNMDAPTDLQIERYRKIWDIAGNRARHMLRSDLTGNADNQ